MSETEIFDLLGGLIYLFVSVPMLFLVVAAIVNWKEMDRWFFLCVGPPIFGVGCLLLAVAVLLLTHRIH